MNIVRLMGGLGNQLFQYAFGRRMQENGIVVRYDISNFGRSRHREYMLGNFLLELAFSPFVGPKTITDSKHYPTFDFSYLKMDGKNFFGYWQYLAYFQDILPMLQREVQLRPEGKSPEYKKLREKIESDQSSAIHIRRDDYLTSDSIPVLPFSYYVEAIGMINGNLYVFSDDVEWCRRHFVEEYFDRLITFVNLPYYQDFELMRLCKHQIIANSTFSWWAAILNDNPEKIVVTPDFWITRLDRAERNNFPKDWIKLHVDV
jgi:hypothetical protein